MNCYLAHSGKSYCSRFTLDSAQTTSSGIPLNPIVYVGGFKAADPCFMFTKNQSLVGFKLYSPKIQIFWKIFWAIFIKKPKYFSSKILVFWNFDFFGKKFETNQCIECTAWIYIADIWWTFSLYSCSPLLFCWKSELYKRDDAKLNIGDWRVSPKNKISFGSNRISRWAAFNHTQKCPKSNFLS